MKFQLFFFIFMFVLLSSSCTVEKRIYTKGYHVSKSQTLKPKKGEVQHAKKESITTDYLIAAPVLDASKTTTFSSTSLLPNSWKVAGDCDVIYFKDGAQIDARIIMISDTEIRYKKCKSNDEILFSTSIDNVFMIEYANGEKFIPKREISIKDKEEKDVVVKTYINNSPKTSEGKQMNPLSILSFVFGIIGISFAFIALLLAFATSFAGPFLFLFLGVLLSTAALVVGIISLVQIKRQDRFKGKIYSILGIVLGGVVTLLAFILFLSSLGN